MHNSFMMRPNKSHSHEEIYIICIHMYVHVLSLSLFSAISCFTIHIKMLTQLELSICLDNGTLTFTNIHHNYYILHVYAGNCTLYVWILAMHKCA